MKKFLVYLFLCLMSPVVLANAISLDNETNYPTKGKFGKIAVQWGSSIEATQKANRDIAVGTSIDKKSLTLLSQVGHIKLITPPNARYLRIVVWSKDQNEPDLLTNWVEIIPKKNYIINQDQLVQSVLISGSGC